MDGLQFVVRANQCVIGLRQTGYYRCTPPAAVGDVPYT
jgi:hypothetical protein